MRVTDNFLSYGVRVDVPVWEDGQILIQELFLY
jgi:hypothetical protein